MVGHGVRHLIKESDALFDDQERLVDFQRLVTEGAWRHPATPRIGIEEDNFVASTGRANSDNRMVQDGIEQAVAPAPVMELDPSVADQGELVQSGEQIWIGDHDEAPGPAQVRQSESGDCIWLWRYHLVLKIG